MLKLKIQSYFLPLFLLLHSVPIFAKAIHFSSGEQQAQLIELFTSQGCSSCPPAERWLNKWVDDHALWHSIVPIAFHVDYWDYLGWKDPYASKVFSAKQRSYYRKGNIKSVYTPGFVVNGQEWRGYHKRYALPKQTASGIKLTATLDHDALSIEAKRANVKMNTHLRFHMAILGVGIKTNITRGENSHRTLPQDFVAIHYQESLSKNGSLQWSLPKYEIDSAQRYGLAIWVSDIKTNYVYQAAGTWL